MNESKTAIDPRAAVDPAARIAEGVTIGPFSVIGPDVSIGSGSVIGPHVVIEGRVTIGTDNRIAPFCSIGLAPQDLKYKGEPTELVIGNGNTFRESCALHRGTVGGGGVTRIGNNGYFMVGSHIAHDCHVGDNVLFNNAGTLGGHVEVGDNAVIGAFSGVHQFTRIGAFAFIGGYSAVTRDVLPFCTVVGNRALCYGPNRIGLRRRGISSSTVLALDAAVRTIFRLDKSRQMNLAEVEERWGGIPEVRMILDFIAGSRRGLVPLKFNAGAEGEE